MATFFHDNNSGQKPPVKRRRRELAQWGSAAVGTSGTFALEVDEAVSGATGWQIYLDAPSFYFLIKVGDARCQLGELLDFLGQDHDAAAGELALGKPGGGRVKLLRDDETPGRYFLHVSGGNYLVRVTLMPADVKHIVAAIEDVLGQLAE
jgi:hypothetical protein